MSDIPLLNGLFGFEYDRFSLEPITLNEQSKTTTLLGRYEKKGEFTGIQAKGYLQDYFGVTSETQAKRQNIEILRIENMMPGEWIEIHTLFFRDRLIDFKAFSSRLCGVESKRQISNLSNYELKTILTISELGKLPQEHCQQIRDSISKLSSMPDKQLENQMLLLKHDIETSTIEE
ncbi:hypothetical protein [Thorsellia anophelis]|uniref:Uncharacterized protein n=1 Tax=Thorsellia anophelis DSM 18579 TaxID=1123402 RepID=A0A1I0BBA2_9GAMM|nr:hypothetical protein [Thorsellia anophelis]SET04030.1 hypothetical protein SAMN02583745_01225 [Thorsellia anophelis DSM 18579]